jgi:acetylornithine deacetylase/succinyl-diaminopimelate desuccinylase-like protein
VKFQLTVRGPAGHGSMPTRGGTTARLGRLLTTLDRKRMPVHIVPATRMMLEGIAEHTEGTTRRAVQSLLNPRTAGTTLKVLHKQLGVMEPLLRNTVSATVVEGGDKHNVIPAEVRVTLDGRMLPGLQADEMSAELRDIIGPDIEITYEVDGKPGPAEPDMGLFPLLANVLRRLDPSGIPVPFMMPAVTDGRWFAQLGIQPYGFTPMTLPADFNFQSTVHAADERIPVDAIGHGADAIYQVLTRYEG